MIDPIMIGTLGMIALLAMMAVGISIGASMMILGFFGIMILISPAAALTKLAIVPFSYVASYDYAVIPMFMLMANIILVSGLGSDLFNIASKWLGHKRGGLGIATTAACAGFAAISSSGLTTSLTIGATALPEMKKYKYDQGFSAAIITASGTIGLMIPPSSALMVYGIVTGNSVRSLFMAGAIPGITQALFYVVVIYLLTKWKPELGPAGPRYGMRERWASLKQGGEIIVLIIFVFTGMLAGWFTPTEAGAMGAIGAFVITVVRRRLDWQRFKKAIVDTIKISGMYFVILIGAQVFMYFTTMTTFPQVISGFVTGLHLPPMVIMMIIIAIYLFLGCLMSGNAMMLLTIPIFYPIILDLGINPILFGIILTRVSETGQITPPVGLGVYSIKALLPDVPIQNIFKWTFPFVISDILHVLMLLFFPIITMFLPNLIGGR